jgi:Uma2 family endonuclease
MNVDAPAQPHSGTMDVDEFMAFIEPRPDTERWELIEGVAVFIAPPTLAHRRIAYNLCSRLDSAFGANSLDLCAYPNVAVRCPGLRSFQAQPDVSVLPGIAGYELYRENFQLVAEIVSPANTRQEIALKLRRYSESPTNLYAMVLDAHEFLVEIYAKRRDWKPAILKNADDPIDMPEFGLHCRVGELYAGTPLDPPQTA